MNSVGIDISKGRSTVAVMRPFGEVVISPFEVRHTGSELSKLARQLKSLDGETRVVMEATGNYHASVAKLLHDAGQYVSVVNAKLVHDYGNNELRRVKTDRKDAVKLADHHLLGLRCPLIRLSAIPLIAVFDLSRLSHRVRVTQ